MGSVGDSYDNALAENFFSTLKVELVYRTSFRTRQDADLALFRYVDGWCNPHRIQRRLGWRSPEEYEARLLSQPEHCHHRRNQVIRPPENRGKLNQITISRPGLPSQIWQFARHFIEMCVAMCIGGAILTALLFVAGPALLGYPDLREQSPELALVVIAFNLALPMAVWMRFRGMAWRPTLEMFGATIGLGSCWPCWPYWPGPAWSRRARSAPG